MLNLKKKLSALVPGEAARSQLQNVLTVEWSGNKTVLVELPPSERSNDVEMAGLGGGSEYDRLVDDDDEDVEWDGPAGGQAAARGSTQQFVQSRFGQQERREAYPEAKSIGPGAGGTARAHNPFANPFLHDDELAGLGGSSSFGASSTAVARAGPSVAGSATAPPPPPKRPTLSHPKNRSWDRSSTSRPFASPTHSTAGSSFSSSTKNDDDPFR
ncbi:hypothetical protein Q8F55_000659 [Vanrija albida]|uniref:Uncharacterized protein n=1 Tax=Vanrija albida TaxID=181172 RepID=A0ABR3QE29_9TREE